MSVCTNLGRDLPSRLAAYDGYVVLFARLRSQRAHQCAPAIADPRNFCPLSQWVCVPIWSSTGPAVRPPMLDMWCCAHKWRPTIFIALSQWVCLPMLGRIGIAVWPPIANRIMLRARLRAQRTHICALAIADALSSSHCPNEYFCQVWTGSAEPCGRL
jgi:hypothetical protein